MAAVNTPAEAKKQPVSGQPGSGEENSPSEDGDRQPVGVDAQAAPARSSDPASESEAPKEELPGVDADESTGKNPVPVLTTATQAGKADPAELRPAKISAAPTALPVLTPRPTEHTVEPGSLPFAQDPSDTVAPGAEEASASPEPPRPTRAPATLSGSPSSGISQSAAENSRPVGDVAFEIDLAPTNDALAHADSPAMAAADKSLDGGAHTRLTSARLAVELASEGGSAQGDVQQGPFSGTVAGESYRPAADRSEGKSEAAGMGRTPVADLDLPTKEMPQVARDLQIRLNGPGELAAWLRVSDRQGNIRVAVHASNPELVGNLGTGLGELATRLSSTGYKVEIADSFAQGLSDRSARDSSEPNSQQQQPRFKWEQQEEEE